MSDPSWTTSAPTHTFTDPATVHTIVNSTTTMALERLSTDSSSGGGGALVSDTSAVAWTMGGMFYSVFSVLMVFGPVVGYLEQWRRMHQSRSADGYSPFVSLILIASSSLRILYYFGEPFALMLLWQSLVMLTVQFGLLVTVLKIRLSQRIMTSVAVSNTGNTGSSFGNREHQTPSHMAVAWWNPLTYTPAQLVYRYVLVCVALAAAAATLFHIYPDSAPGYLGYVALGVEATLVTPQIWLNLRRKSTEGLGIVLVATWCVGDVVKMIFFIAERQPTPFVVCGSLQLCCDAVVLFQLWLYKNPLARKGYGVHGTEASTAEASYMVSGGASNSELDGGTPSNTAAVVVAPLTESRRSTQQQKEWF